MKKKVVGALFVTAVLAGGAPAQADPVGISQYSGLGVRQHADFLENSSSTHESEAAWSRVSFEVRDRLADRDDDDDAEDAFVSLARTHPENYVHDRLKPGKAEKFWKGMHRGWSGCLPRESPGPQPSATPEPASMILLGSGLVGLVGVRRRRQQ